MTNSIPLAQIEHAIGQLSYDERLWLIERLVNGLRLSSRNGKSAKDKALAEMAADPEIQRELTQIGQEFSGSEMDGLEER